MFAGALLIEATERKWEEEEWIGERPINRYLAMKRLRRLHEYQFFGEDSLNEFQRDTLRRLRERGDEHPAFLGLPARSS